MDHPQDMTIAPEIFDGLIFQNSDLNMQPPSDQFAYITSRLMNLVDPLETNGFFKQAGMEVLDPLFREAFEKWYDQFAYDYVKWGALISYVGEVLKVGKIEARDEIRDKETLSITIGRSKKAPKSVPVYRLKALSTKDVEISLAQTLDQIIGGDRSVLTLLRIGRKDFNELLLHSAFYPPPDIAAANTFIYNIGRGIYFTDCLSYIMKQAANFQQRGIRLSQLSVLVLRVSPEWLHGNRSILFLEKPDAAEMVSASLQQGRDDTVYEYMAVLAKGICSNPNQVSRCNNVEWFRCRANSCACQSNPFELCIKSLLLIPSLVEASEFSIVHL